MPTFRTLTLGCKVNQYETEQLCQTLVEAGFAPAEEGEAADFCFIHTCTVTREADLKSRKAIRQAIRRNPRGRVIVTGCYAKRAGPVLRSIEGVSEVFSEISDLAGWLRSVGIERLADGIHRFGERHRAYVKIQDGCVARCSYCVIPLCRPRLVSRPIEEILREISRLAENGYREIVLTGIHLGFYGVDEVGRNVGPGFEELLERIARMPGEFRVRISSIHATELTEGLIETICTFPKRICPHVHLSLQSGSDEVLARMNRRYSAAEYVEKCQRLRQRVEMPALTTDVIVGFPGETERDFEQTLKVLRAVGFLKVHTFRFSPREGTAAARMVQTVSSAEKVRRAAEVAELEKSLRKEYLRRLMPIPLQVLVERYCGPRLIRGTAGHYVPVEMDGDARFVGDLVTALPSSIREGRIVAKLDRDRLRTNGPAD